MDSTFGNPANAYALTATGAIGPATLGGWYAGYLVTTDIAGGDVSVYAAQSATGPKIDLIPSGATKGTRFLVPGGINLAAGAYAQFAGTGGVTFFRN